MYAVFNSFPSFTYYTVCFSGEAPFSHLIRITQGDRSTHNVTDKNNHRPYMVKIPVEGGNILFL